MLHDILNALEETLFMVFSAGLLTWVLGLPLGTALAVTRPHQFLANRFIYRPLRLLIQTTQSVPYIILMIALIPVTRFVVGSAEGAIAAIIPLTLAATPYFALLCEKAIQSVPTGIVETARSIGASPTQIMYKILLPEALPNIIKALTSMLVHLVGYSTIAGAIGSGGLGELMIHKGYQTFEWEYVLVTVAMMVALVRIIQSCGDYIANGTLSSSSNTSL